jgi:hypothetical protein
VSELPIRHRGWRVECQRPAVNNPAGVFVARVFVGHGPDGAQIGLGMAEASMDAAIAEAYRSACETVNARPVRSGEHSTSAATRQWTEQ